MDPRDARLLDMIQSAFPLVSEPFAALGQELGFGASDVIERIRDLKTRKVIRRIGASFSTHALGHAGALVAMQVPAERLEAVASQVSAFAEVTHNYGRDHTYNLWFTLVADNEQRVAQLAFEISRETSVTDYHLLPAERVFKIRVEFQFGEHSTENSPRPPPDLPPAGGGATHSSLAGSAAAPLTFDPALVRVLQSDLPLVDRPFAILAEEAEMAEDKLIELARAWKTSGVIRRYGAVLNHQQAGYAHNVMAVWNVPEAQVEKMGQTMSEFCEVSHCYQRPRFKGFPFNLYTMIHGRSRDECAEVVKRMVETTGIRDYQLLYTVKEFKKTSPLYFTRSGKTANRRQ